MRLMPDYLACHENRPGPGIMGTALLVGMPGKPKPEADAESDMTRLLVSVGSFPGPVDIIYSFIDSSFVLVSDYSPCFC